MALQLHDLTAWVAIGRLGVEVYRVEKPQPNHVTCWIASEAGKKFSVNWRNATREFPLQGTVTIDRLKCNSHIMLDAQSYPNRLNSVGISYARTSEYTQRDFMFAPMQVTDDDAYLDTAAHHDEPFGIITLEIYRLQVLSVVTQPSQHVPTQALEPQTVHARSNRAGTHQVRYADEYFSPAPIVDIVSGCTIGDAPYAIFTFKYRPLEMLISSGIAPPAPFIRELKIIPDKNTEIAQLEARLAALRSKKGTPHQAQDSNPYPIAGSSRGRKDPQSKRPRKSKADMKKPLDEPVVDLDG